MTNAMYIPFNNTIAITVSDYLSCGFSYDIYKNDKRRGYISVLTRGGNGREALIDFNSIKKADRRAAIVKKLGEPDRAHKTPYIKEILPDQEAVEYFKIRRCRMWLKNNTRTRQRY
jgi:hypothetical protein